MLENPNRNHVLLVEDNVPVAFSWAKQLEARGYDVAHCVDIHTALKSCNYKWPDAIILDAFFKETCVEYEGSGGLMFCSQLLGTMRNSKKKKPFILGVSGARVDDGSQQGVFSNVPRSVMPVRMQKPVTGSQLADKLDEARMMGAMKDASQLDFAF